MPRVDTSLDPRGLRRFDKDGHPIAWFAPDRLRPHGGGGAAQGRCTEGHWWTQQNGTPPRLSDGHDPRRGGSIEFGIELVASDDGDSPNWLLYDKSYCAGHHFDAGWKGHKGGLKRTESDYADSDARAHLIQKLEGEGWRIWIETRKRPTGLLRSTPHVPQMVHEVRVWCPECVRESQALEAESESLRAQAVPA